MTPSKPRSSGRPRLTFRTQRSECGSQGSTASYSDGRRGGEGETPTEGVLRTGFLERTTPAHSSRYGGRRKGLRRPSGRLSTDGRGAPASGRANASITCAVAYYVFGGSSIG